MTEIRLTRGDITTLAVDVIVNAANGSLQGGGGVDGAIHAAAGPSLAEEGRRIVNERGPLRAGEVAITGAGLLPSRFVIHAVGPVWGRQAAEESVALLESCYRSSLELASANDCRTIAFPNISTGIFGFPTELAAKTAVAAVSDWVSRHPDLLTEVIFVCFTDENHGLYRAELAR